MKYPNIEAERIRHKLSRRTVALYLGVRKEIYIGWIKGTLPIPAIFLYRLCDLFRCSLDYLLSSDDRGYKWRMYHRI